MSLLERDDVPEPKSLASTSPTVRPRVAASRATPAPTTPPPMTRTWNSPLASPSRAAARSAGPRRPDAVTGSPRALWFGATCVPADRAAGQIRPSARRGTGRHHHLYALEFLEIGVARRRHRPPERAHDVHGAVRDL